MRYTAEYFRNNLPEWKRQKDSLMTKIFYRPLSFFVASFCANRGITANDVSVFASFVALAACSFFVIPGKMFHVLGAICVSFWLVLDCTDGNLARSVRQQAFGEFVDATSSYLLVGLLGICLGLRVYLDGGFFISKGEPWIIFVGALASSSDSLMRLIYQKYINLSKELQMKKIIPEEKEIRTDIKGVRNLRVRLELEPGIAGLLPLIIFLFTIMVPIKRTTRSDRVRK